MVCYLLYLYSVSSQGKKEVFKLSKLETNSVPQNLDVPQSSTDETFEYKQTENDDNEADINDEAGKTEDVWGQKDGNKIRMRNVYSDGYDKQDTLRDRKDEDNVDIEGQFEI